jgi:hypothetical protein
MLRRNSRYLALTALITVAFLVLSGCEDLHGPKTWATGIDTSVYRTKEQISSELARRNSRLDGDINACDQTADTRNEFVHCMNLKGWSLIPAFPL